MIAFLDPAQIHRPWQRRAAPDLTDRAAKFRALLNRADAEPVARRILRHRSVDRSAAVAAERVRVLFAAVLDVDLRFAAQHFEIRGRRWNDRAICRPANRLTISAVA